VTTPAPGLVPRLAYVALVVGDVAATARVLERDFRLLRADCAVGGTAGAAPVFALGESALALFGPGDSFVGGRARAGVHHIALEVADLDQAARAVAAAGVRPAGGAEVGLGRARRRALDPASLAGVRAYLSEPLALSRWAGSTGGGWVERLDHVGVASVDNAAVIESFVARLGLALESTQTDLEVQIAVESFTSDKYGAVYHTRAPDPVGGLRVAFVTVGDCDLEFLQDFDPRQGAWVSPDLAGTTKQDQGAIARFVAARGPGLHHLALKVTDIDHALAELGRAGHALIDRMGRPGSRRARIGFLHPRSLHGVLMHLVQRDAA